MEIGNYIAPLRKWWWLLVAAVLVGTASAYLATRELPLTYQAHTTLIVGRGLSQLNPNEGDISLARQLAQSYADIIEREPIRNATMQRLGLTKLPDYNATANGNLLEISVTDTSPERAEAVARELASQLIKQTPSNTQAEADVQRQEFIALQLDGLERDIEKTQDDIAQLQSELGQLDSASKLADAEAKLEALQKKLTTLTDTYSRLLASTQKGAVNQIEILEPASLPVKPIGPNKLLIIALAAVSGLVLAGGAAYLLEYLNDALERPEDVSEALKVPVIGYIADMGKSAGEKPHVAENPSSLVAEAFRSLGANVEFAMEEKAVKTIFVNSAGMAEGKTTTATNLAIVLAQSGKKVILVDADIHQPGIHRFLGIHNQDGLSDVFRGQLDIHDVIHTWKEENLAVITAGNAPLNSMEMINSKKMGQTLSRLKDLADVVIVDGPSFSTADAWALASKVDGVLLVVRSGRTRKPVVKAMMEQLNRGGARVFGVALNRIPRHHSEYFGAYWYISPYYASNRQQQALPSANTKPKLALRGATELKANGKGNRPLLESSTQEVVKPN
jgi:capsular exopolysaccharide synthesis family protein